VTPQTTSPSFPMNAATPIPSILGRIAVAALLLWPVVVFAMFFIILLSVSFVAGVQSGFYSLAMSLFLFVMFAGLLRMIQMGLSVANIRKRKLNREVGMEWTLPDSPRVLPVSVLVWAHNRGDVIVDRVERLLALDYPKFEVIVINDGSTDNTPEILEEAFDLHPVQRVVRRSLPVLTDGTILASPRHPNLIVIEKPATGRDDSLNFAMNVSGFPLVCPLDLNHVLEPHALVELTRGFIEDQAHTIAVATLAGFLDDPATDIPNELGVRLSSEAEEGVVPAVAGIARPLPSVFMARPLDDLQRIDRTMIFHSAFLLQEGIGNVALVRGIVSLLKKSEIVEAGGYTYGDNGDTLSLLLNIYSAGDDGGARVRRVVFLPDVLARFSSLATMDEVLEAREQIQYNTLDAVTRHFPLAFGGQGGWQTRASLPTFLIASLIAPMLEPLAILAIDFAAFVGALTFEEITTLLFGLITLALADALGGLLCDEYSGRTHRAPSDIQRLTIAAFKHAFGFRWMMTIAQLRGTLAFILGR
jgi:cellulose synthase/poly-beta-1,6-N-acetylglucosamine synthase-like glycosyltransferase